jgi:hypothetical protein
MKVFFKLASKEGVGSRLYDRGRSSPTCETGTHRFHRFLAELLSRYTGPRATILRRDRNHSPRSKRHVPRAE